MGTKIAMILVCGLATFAGASQARAGQLTDSADLLFATPFVGAEFARVQTATRDEYGVIGLQGLRMGPSLTLGGIGGVRLGPFAVGVLYQRTEGRNASANTGVILQKVYGEFALHIPYGAMVGVVHVDFGWAYLDTSGTISQGVGGKLGAALDYHVTRWLSLGAGAALDLQGYSTRTELVGGWGATACGRLGLHL